MNYTLKNSTVSSQEADALKEMIFKRARERAQALTDDVQSNYTTSVQNDIMDLARDSFVSIKNPFSEGEPQKPANTSTENAEIKTEEIGFAQRHVNEIREQIYTRSKRANSTIAGMEVESAMEDARTALGKRTGFMGALDFLNSQASITLVKNKGKTFEALA